MRPVSAALRAIVQAQISGRPWLDEHAQEFFHPFPARRRRRSPDRQKDYETRHRLAYSGVMPRWLAERFTTGDMAVMKIIGDKHSDRGFCDLSLKEIGDRAGVCRKTVRRAMKAAGSFGKALISIQIRWRRGRKNLTNVVRVVSREWLSWLARGATCAISTGGHLCPPTDNRYIKQPAKTRFEMQQEGIQGEKYASPAPTRPPPGTRGRAYV